MVTSRLLAWAMRAELKSLLCTPTKRRKKKRSLALIRDKNIDWLERRVLLLAQDFQTFITGAGVSTGAPVFQQIAASGITGIQVNQASDAIATLWMPSDIDRSKQIRFRVWWSKNSADADVETATVTYTAYVAGTTVIIDPATALSTAIPAYTFGTTANVLEVTGFGVINKNTLLTTTAMLGLKVASTMTTASANEINIVGLEIRYTPRLMNGPEKNLVGGRRLAIAAPLGVTLATTAATGGPQEG
jgi:hypothetical protein